VTADQVYVDPSALTRLYFDQSGSREMVGWRRKIEGALPVTHHGRAEIVNAIALALFRGALTAKDAARAWGWMDTDFAEGHLVQADILWRAALNRASELSRSFTPTVGARSLDVLHVACAIEMGLHYFVSFDTRQKALAKAAGLKLLAVD
jgi:predicted nucleic acid-binding protein